MWSPVEQDNVQMAVIADDTTIYFTHCDSQKLNRKVGRNLKALQKCLTENNLAFFLNINRPNMFFSASKNQQPR